MVSERYVSVIIPCYNAEKYLSDCLDALLKQTYKNVEVIIVNDGSTDNSESIIDSYISQYDKRGKKLIKINQKNQGQAAAVNNALKYVTGDYLMWQDADDWYEVDAIENMVQYLIDNNMKFARGEVANRRNNTDKSLINIGKSKYPYPTNIFDNYVFETDISGWPGIFITEMSYFDACVKNREIYVSRAGQNWQLILPLAFYEPCGNLNKVIYNYRVVENSHSHSVKKMKDLINRCDDHKDILFHVLDTIDGMNPEEKNKYKHKINIKYRKKKLCIFIRCIGNKLIRNRFFWK